MRAAACGDAANGFYRIVNARRGEACPSRFLHRQFWLGVPRALSRCLPQTTPEGETLGERDRIQSVPVARLTPAAAHLTDLVRARSRATRTMTDGWAAARSSAASAVVSPRNNDQCRGCRRRAVWVVDQVDNFGKRADRCRDTARRKRLGGSDPSLRVRVSERPDQARVEVIVEREPRATDPASLGRPIVERIAGRTEPCWPVHRASLWRKKA